MELASPNDSEVKTRDLREKVEEGEHELEYDEVLQQIGFGRTQWQLLLISGLLTMSSMAAQTNVSIIGIASQCEFDMSQMDKGVLMAACVTGVSLSTYVWGYVCDDYGRRTVLLRATFTACFLQFATIFITNIWLFNTVNLFMGISFGGISSCIYAYLSEFNTDKYRAVVINYSTMFVSITAIYVPAMAWLVISSEWSLHISDGYVLRAWRLLILASILPGFIGGLALLLFPESPKFLLAQNKHAEAIAAVDWICQWNTRRTLTSVIGVDSIRLRPESENVEVRGNNGVCSTLVGIWRATLPLFHKPHRRNFIICALTMFGLFFNSSVAIWFPEIVNRSSAAGANSSAPVCGILEESFATDAEPDVMHLMIGSCDDSISTPTYVNSIIVAAVNVVGMNVQGLLLNPMGRKNVLIGALVLTTLSGCLLFFVTSSIAVLVLFCVFIVMPSLAISVMCGVSVDLMPTHLRGKAVSLCLTLGRFGIVVALNFIGLTLENQCTAMFVVFIAAILICLFLVRSLPI